jgi:hypothetical protein
VRRQRHTSKWNPPPGDFQAAEQLADALEQVEEMPYEDQWSLAMALLPDSFFVYTVRAKRREEEARTGLFTLLALTAIRYLLEEKPTMDLTYLTVIGMMISCDAELEKRRKRFSTDVIHMTAPFEFDPAEPVKYIPRDPDHFKASDVHQYHLACDESEL